MVNRRDFLRAAAALPIAASTGSPDAVEISQKLRRPIVVSTWDSGMSPNAAAWEILSKNGKAIDAVEAAGRKAEDESGCCVGLDAFPDRDGYVTLDAAIMDHLANCGSVVYLQGIKHPISVARRLMETTKHVLLAGEGAFQFAVRSGFEPMPRKLSPDAEKEWKEWLKKSEYKPVINIENRKQSGLESGPPMYLGDGAFNHDTMGTVALDGAGNLSGGCTTSGMAFKMHGRVGDSPIIGAGLFVDNKVGAATCSGVGEEVIRICGTHLVVELMRQGKSPLQSCREAVLRIVDRDPKAAKEMQVGFVALSKSGHIGAYSIQGGFSYSVRNAETNRVFQSPSHFPPAPRS